MSDRATAFLKALGYPEEPFGMFYTDTEPESGFVQKEGPAFSSEMEQRGEVDYPALFRDWSCVMGKIWLARKKKSAAYFEARRFGCVGGSFYLGFHRPQLEFIAHYVSTGIPGRMEGERYLSSPEVTRRFFNELPPRPPRQGSAYSNRLACLKRMKRPRWSLSLPVEKLWRVCAPSPLSSPMISKW